MIINEVRSANVRGVRVYKNQGKYYVRKGDTRKEISKDEYDKLMDILPSEVKPKTKKSSTTTNSDKKIDIPDELNKSDDTPTQEVEVASDEPTTNKSSTDDKSDKSDTKKGKSVPRKSSSSDEESSDTREPIITADNVADVIDKLSDWIKDNVISNLAHR